MADADLVRGEQERAADAVQLESAPGLQRVAEPQAARTEDRKRQMRENQHAGERDERASAQPRRDVQQRDRQERDRIDLRCDRRAEHAERNQRPVEHEQHERERQQERRPEVVRVEEDRSDEQRCGRDHRDRSRRAQKRDPQRAQGHDCARDRPDPEQRHQRLERERVVRRARDAPQEEHRLRERRVLVEEVAVRNLPGRHVAAVGRIHVQVRVESRVEQPVPDEQAGDEEGERAHRAERDRLARPHSQPTAPL